MTTILKYLTKSLNISKVEALELLSDGDVEINKKIVLDPNTMVKDEDKVTITGQKVETKEDIVYLIVNKPSGMKDPREVINGQYKNLKIIGELDPYERGLVILSNDPKFIELIKGSYDNIEKEYSVIVKGLLRREESKTIKGMRILNVKYNDNKTSTSMNIITKAEEAYMIKDSMRNVNHEVSRVERERIGNIVLDIKASTYRFMKPFEMKSIKLLALGKISTTNKKKKTKTTSNNKNINSQDKNIN